MNKALQWHDAKPSQLLKHTPISLASDLTWQQATASTVNDLQTLADYLALDAERLHTLCTESPFALRVPLPYVARMAPENYQDPLLLQILPLKDEAKKIAGYVSDPLGETQANPCAGIVHKYKGRVLLTAASSCPINCRYCFRRHFPYQQNRLTPKNWQTAIDYIAQKPDITEVILSGGEPLLLNDKTLSRLLDALENVAHVKLLRIHTRFPVVIPQRISKQLCERLKQSRFNVTMVLHCNHANEVDDHMLSCIAPLKLANVTLLSQTVLLKNINDNTDALKALSYRLFDAGVLPYYLHATDPVEGTAHFTVPDEKARTLVKSLQNSMPGYLVPTLVREIAGEPAKTRL